MAVVQDALHWFGRLMTFRLIGLAYSWDARYAKVVKTWKGRKEYDPVFTTAYLTRQSRSMPYLRKVLEKLGHSVKDLVQISIKISPEQLQTAEGRKFVHEVLSHYRNDPHTFSMTRRQLHFVFMRLKTWTKGLDAGMRELGEPNPGISVLQQDEKIMSRISASVPGNPKYGQSELPRVLELTKGMILKSAAYVVRCGISDKIVGWYAEYCVQHDLPFAGDGWLENAIAHHNLSMMDGSIFFSRDYALRLTGKKELRLWSVLKVVRIFCQGKYVAKGHGIVLKHLRWEGVEYDIVIPAPSMTTQFLPEFSGVEVGGIAKGVPVKTDRQIIVTFPSLDFARIVWEYWLRILKATVARNWTELLELLHTAVTADPDLPEDGEDDLDYEEIAQAKTQLGAMRRLDNPAVFPELAQAMKRMFDKGGQLLDQIRQKGRCPMTAESAVYGYIMPDMAAFDCDLLVYDPTKAVLEADEISAPDAVDGRRVVLLRRPIGSPSEYSKAVERKYPHPLPSCVLLVNIWTIQSVLANGGGADFDDLFIIFRRLTLVLSVWEGRHWEVKEIPAKSQELLKMFEFPTPEDSRPRNWKSIVDSNIDKLTTEGFFMLGGIPIGNAGIGLWASTVGCLVPVLRNIRRWLETGMSDELGPDMQFIPIQQVVLGWGKDALSLLDTLIRIADHSPEVFVLLWKKLAEMIIDWGNGKYKFGARYIHIAQMFIQLLNVLNELLIRVSPYNGFHGGRCVRVADVDKHWDGVFPVQPRYGVNSPRAQFNVIAKGWWQPERGKPPLISPQLKIEGATQAWYSGILTANGFHYNWNPPCPPDKSACGNVIDSFKRRCLEYYQAGRLSNWLMAMYMTAYQLRPFKAKRIGKYVSAYNARFPQSYWLDNFMSQINPFWGSGVLNAAAAEAFGANLTQDYMSRQWYEELASIAEVCGGPPQLDIPAENLPTKAEIEEALEFHISWTKASLTTSVWSNAVNSKHHTALQLMETVAKCMGMTLDQLILEKANFSDRLLWLSDEVADGVTICGAMTCVVLEYGTKK